MVLGAGSCCHPQQDRMVLFSHKKSSKGYSPPGLEGVELSLSESVKFLGVSLDRKLEKTCK